MRGSGVTFALLVSAHLFELLWFLSNPCSSHAQAHKMTDESKIFSLVGQGSSSIQGRHSAHSRSSKRSTTWKRSTLEATLSALRRVKLSRCPQEQEDAKSYVQHFKLPLSILEALWTDPCSSPV